MRDRGPGRSHTLTARFTLLLLGGLQTRNRAEEGARRYHRRRSNHQPPADNGGAPDGLVVQLTVDPLGTLIPGLKVKQLNAEVVCAMLPNPFTSRRTPPVASGLAQNWVKTKSPLAGAVYKRTDSLAPRLADAVTT